MKLRFYLRRMLWCCGAWEWDFNTGNGRCCWSIRYCSSDRNSSYLALLPSLPSRSHCYALHTLRVETLVTERLTYKVWYNGSLSWLNSSHCPGEPLHHFPHLLCLELTQGEAQELQEVRHTCMCVPGCMICIDEFHSIFHHRNWRAKVSCDVDINQSAGSMVT